MKIIGGKYRGRNFYMPAKTRPTQNITRKAIFDLIGNDLAGLTFLELFAGSGAVGLEALSHGATHVTFVERDQKCIDTIYENLQLFGITSGREPPENIEVMQVDAFFSIKALSAKNRKFDIVFLDPPYELGLLKKALKTIIAYDIVNPNSFVIAEYGKREPLPDVAGTGFSLVKQRQYGHSFLSVYQRQ